ncbi:hypothetical protein JTB14_000957 [Gonioctena quinquepunctata]|nr:hypothetical protein JTB14_000957 [Gonioctena quinquepunctata]
MTRSTAKTEASKTQIMFTISVDELKVILNEAIKVNSDHLLEKIDELKLEIHQLKESNIDMVKMLAKHPHNSIVVQPEIYTNDQNDSFLSGDTVVKNALQKNVNMLLNENDKTKKSDEQRNSYSAATKRSRKSRDRQVLVGTGMENKTDPDEPNEFDDFGASPRRCGYMSAAANPSSTPGLSKYLEKRSPGHEFEVSKLNSMGRNLSYRIEADLELEKTLYTPSHWPMGVIVKRFRFAPKIIEIANSNSPN